jgi:hypothetical protein
VPHAALPDYGEHGYDSLAGHAPRNARLLRELAAVTGTVPSAT